MSASDSGLNKWHYMVVAEGACYIERTAFLGEFQMHFMGRIMQEGVILQVEGRRGNIRNVFT